MGNFVIDIVMEPIRHDFIEVLQFEIEDKIKLWLYNNKIRYENLKVNMYSTRLCIMAKLETTAEFLKNNIAEFFSYINNGDAMISNVEDITLYRPILNVVAFFDDECLIFEFMGVKSSSRNLINFREKIEIKSYNDYMEKMSKYFYDSSEECLEKISFTLKRRAISIGKKLNLSNERVHNLLFINSKLSVIDADFDDRYLELPLPIIETVLHSHKNIFATYYDDGKISNSFLIVYRDYTEKNNIKKSHINMINIELGLIMNLFKKDLKFKLEYYLPRLKWISNIEGLGSMLDKAERVNKIVEKTADELLFADEMHKNLIKLSELMKADLGTRTVKRYPGLKGVVGGEMLKIEGEITGIADAIREQYLPDFRGKMPITNSGAILAIVDRIHDIAGLEILSNLSYKHSWTLRKFDDILKIMINMEAELNFESIIGNTLYSYTENSIGVFDYNDIFDKLYKFFIERFKLLMRKNNIRKFLIDDVFIEKETSINNLFRKLKELSEIEDENLISFIKMIIDYKKLIKNSEVVNGDASLIEAKIGDVLNYAKGKTIDLVSFIKVLYEYKEEFKNLLESYNENEITIASKSLANNFREMWL